MEGAVWSKKDVEDPGEDPSDARGKKRFGPRTAVDIQRSKLAKLMKAPDRPVHIPEPKAAKDPNKAPEFVYNVMGSSAGAGSGEFHVYRQIRRKETLRQGALAAKKDAEDLNEAYHQKLAENERLSQEKTDKKRQKRLKQKQKAKEAGKKKAKEKKKEESSSSEDDSDEEDDETKKNATSAAEQIKDSA